jgi:hypothetical protein
MGRLNWSKDRERHMMKQRGVDPINGAESDAFAMPTSRPPRKRLSKAELRAQAEAAFRQWNSRRS